MKICILTALTLFGLVTLSFADEPGFPRVVASIAPVHSLTAAVMTGTEQPKLVLRSGGSPHSSVLRPSDIEAIQHADLIVWVGPLMEQFLSKALTAAGSGKRTLTLTRIPGLTLHPVREGGIWHATHADDHHEATTDPHIWLDPHNAILISTAIRDELITIDPQRAGTYRRNCDALIRRLKRLDTTLEQQLHPVRTVPYIVFHDAYQTFEAHFGLTAIGAVSIDPERRPGARRLREIRDSLQQSRAVCIFSEPQFEPRYIETLTEGVPIRTGVLDPLGSTLPPGPELYFELMQGLADTLANCLSPPAAATGP